MGLLGLLDITLQVCHIIPGRALTPKIIWWTPNSQPLTTWGQYGLIRDVAWRGGAATPGHTPLGGDK